MCNQICSVAVILLLPWVSGTGTPTSYVKYTKEHKVHNIMLYPEKHSWCRPTPIKQIISHNGCHSIEIENNVCVGACFSFSVPKTIPETPGDDRLYYCDSCQPDANTWTKVVLECPENPSQKLLSKMVEVIENCTCTPFTDSKRYNPGYVVSGESSRESASSGDEDFSAENNNLPDIQEEVMRHTQQKTSTSDVDDDDDDEDEDNYTNSSMFKLHSILKAENISTRERISKYTNHDPEQLLQELKRRRAENEEDEEEEEEE